MALPAVQTIGGQVLLALLASAVITAASVPLAASIYRRDIS
jgi:hypothetical protein